MTTPESTLKILQHAENAQGQKSLAEQAGYSLGKVNFILNALIDKGLIKAERFVASDRKARYRYILTPKGLSEKMRLLEAFVERKRVEYEELAEELERMKGLKP